VGDPRVSSLQLKSCAGDQLIAKRRAEKFKRIKCSTLANLLRQNGSVEESIYQLGNADGMDSVSVVAGQNAQFAV